MAVLTLEHVRSHWEAVRSGLLETIDKFRDEELDFRPFAASWSVRQLTLHIAQEENGELGYGIVQSLDAFPRDYDVRDYPTIDSIRALLTVVHANTLDYLSSLTDGDLERVVNTPWGATYPLLDMVEHIVDHEIHHRAELSLIVGMLGRLGFDA